MIKFENFEFIFAITCPELHSRSVQDIRNILHCKNIVFNWFENKDKSNNFKAPKLIPRPPLGGCTWGRFGTKCSTMHPT